MAAIHHPQIYREESGLCGCELNSSFSVFCFLFDFLVIDSQFADWDFVCCRACIPFVVLETPSPATASASTCTPATPPWLTGVYVFVCKCVPSRNKQMHFHISNGYRILGYALTLISKLTQFFFFSLVPGASTTQMETF